MREAAGLRWGAGESSVLASVAPGDTVELAFEVEIAVPLDNGTVVSVQGEVSGFDAAVLTDDPSSAAPADPTVFRVESAPRLDVFSKTVTDLTGDPLVTLPGDRLRYELRVENTGDAIGRDLSVNDPIDRGFIPETPANATFDGATLRWSASSEPALSFLAPGETVLLSFEGTVDSAASSGQRISNQATVSVGAISELSDDPATPTEDDSTDLFVGGGTDLGASLKQVTDLSGNPIVEAAPGDVVRFVLIVENRGSAAASAVTVTDELVPQFEVVSAVGATVSGGSVRWDSASEPRLTNVAAGERVELNLDVRVASDVASGVELLNQGSVSAAELSNPVLTDADPSTAAKEQTRLRVQGSAALAGSTKLFVDPISGNTLSGAAPGDEIRVQIVLRNSGDGVASDIVVEDPLDLSKLTTIVPRDGGVLAGNTVRCPQTSIDSEQLSRARRQ
ncbi:MAG: hypothetical protein AAFQ82_24765, partial [Myxococcota bacterium]